VKGLKEKLFFENYSKLTYVV